MIEKLFQHEYFILCLVITIGLLIGKIRIRGFSSEIAGVLLAGITFGHFGYSINGNFLQLGLLLFLFSIGIQSGPGMITNFKGNAPKFLLLTLIMVISTALVSWAIIEISGLNHDFVLGLLTGGLSSATGLAIALESVKSEQLLIGYGVAFPFSIVFTLLVLYILPRLFRKNIEKEDESFIQLNQGKYPKLKSLFVRVTNHSLINKTISELEIRKKYGVTISKIIRKNSAEFVNKCSIIIENDIIRITGLPDDICKFAALAGFIVPKDDLHEKKEDFWIYVSNKKILNKTYREANLPSLYDVNILKIRRNGIEMSPTENSKFIYGDKLQVSCDKETHQKLLTVLGGKVKRLEKDFLPLFMGLVIGIIIGQFSVVIGGFKLGTGITGGVLITGLVFGYFGKTGPMLWAMSGWSIQLVRRFGLLLFIAGIGLKAGGNIVHSISEYGPVIVFYVFLIQLIPAIIITFIGTYLLKLNFLSSEGCVIGTLTSSAGLAALSSKTRSNAVPLAYSTVFPFALIFIILTVQFWIMLFN